MYMQRTASGAAGNGLYTTIKYMRGAAGIGLGTTIKHLRRTTSGAAGNGLGAAIKYLRCATSAVANSDAQRSPPRAMAWAPRSNSSGIKTRAREATGPRPAYTKAGREFR